MNEKKSVGLAVASMVLGIVSLLFGCCFWYVTIPASIIAVILAAVSISKKMGGKGMAVTGLVTGIISLVPAIIVLVTGSSLMAKFSSEDDSKAKINNNESSIVEEYDESSSEDATFLSEDITEAVEVTIPQNEELSITESSEISNDEIIEAVNNGDYSLVTPEFKEYMDSYENFYDNYIEFMKKYNSDDANVTEMMLDYTNMLSDLSKWTEEIDKIDESTLSTADDAYFILVTLRIEKKLLDASISLS